MFLIKKFVIKGKSMSPLLKPGSTILASSLPYLFMAPKRKDVVTCKDPRNGRIIVKRIIKIDNKKYFISGDNPMESTDSRHFGYINLKDIMGKVVFIKRSR